MGDSTNPGRFFEAGARIAVHSGATNRKQFLIYPESPAQAFRVGASADCNWQVFADGVAPAHFELSWDGQDLFVDPAPGSPGVIVNGATHRHRHRITGEARVQFGDACIYVQAGISAEDAGAGRQSSVNTPFHVARPPKLVPDRSMVRTAFGIASADLAAMIAEGSAQSVAEGAAQADGLAFVAQAHAFAPPAHAAPSVRALRMLTVSAPERSMAWHAAASSAAGSAFGAGIAVSTPVSNLAKPVVAVSTPTPRLARVPGTHGALAVDTARPHEPESSVQLLGKTLVRERYMGPPAEAMRERPSGSPRSPLFITPSAPRDEYMRALSAREPPAIVPQKRQLTLVAWGLLAITSLPLLLPSVRHEVGALAGQLWRAVLALVGR